LEDRRDQIAEMLARSVQMQWALRRWLMTIAVLAALLLLVALFR
jgi:hypothetical protein